MCGYVQYVRAKANKTMCSIIHGPDLVVELLLTGKANGSILHLKK